MAANFDLVVFSHLRWDFVFQRPQHLLSRFARRHRVIFIEEPTHTAGEAFWQIRSEAGNVLVCRAHTNESSFGFSDSQLAAMNRMMPQLFADIKLGDHVAWFYTPMALPLIDNFTPKAVIYDCMDELSAFWGAAPELIEREDRLLKLADLVFTGGPSLYRAKKNRHSNAHCFPSSVDAKHYASAKPGSTLEQARDQGGLPTPRIGYFGVVDERIDLQLLEHVAKSRPEWQICVVGPVVKINPDTMPKLPNIHYFGQRQYDQLPSYLAGWDVCMLPFARNQATKFISPTKTLEYMAAERMIVSTPITDVAEPYGHVVFMGSTPEEFLQACQTALDISAEERAARVQLMRAVLSKTSWDSTANRMLALINEAIKKTSYLDEGVFVPAAAKHHKPESSVVPAVWATQVSQAQGD